jgi:hypothetical protein
MRIAGGGGSDPPLTLIQDDRTFERKVQLYVEAGHGPDGHDMQDGAYARIERVKCRAGYMVSYLYWENHRPAAAVSLAVQSQLARVKNIVVHPDFRCQGVLHRVLCAMVSEAANAGARVLGLFAAEGSTAHRRYVDFGLREVGRQVEWTKAL